MRPPPACQRGARAIRPDKTEAGSCEAVRRWCLVSQRNGLAWKVDAESGGVLRFAAFGPSAGSHCGVRASPASGVWFKGEGRERAIRTRWLAARRRGLTVEPWGMVADWQPLSG